MFTALQRVEYARRYKLNSVQHDNLTNVEKCHALTIYELMLGRLPTNNDPKQNILAYSVFLDTPKVQFKIQDVTLRKAYIITAKKMIWHYINNFNQPKISEYDYSTAQSQTG